MAQIRETEQGFMYVVDEFAIPLHEDSFQAYQHRSLGHTLLDWVGVQDPRDEMYFSHFRYDQGDKVIDEMIELCKIIGTYVLTSTPYEHIQAMFDKNHSIQEDDFTALLEEPHE